jgi:hypothetical protein
MVLSHDMVSCVKDAEYPAERVGEFAKWTGNTMFCFSVGPSPDVGLVDSSAGLIVLRSAS